MESYIVGIRRDARDKAPPDWQKTLEGIEGVTITGAANPRRVQIVASLQAIERVRELCGEYCHIEAPIEHRPLQALDRGNVLDRGLIR